MSYPKKLKSTLQHYELLDQVFKEIEHGRIMGPFDQLLLANVHLSPLGFVPKSKRGGGGRIITHVLYPVSVRLSFRIDLKLCTFQYGFRISLLTTFVNR